ncbi:MAG: hypothetical protein ACRDT2_22680 [Natronosporangium sp.]
MSSVDTASPFSIEETSWPTPARSSGGSATRSWVRPAGNREDSRSSDPSTSSGR